MTRDIESLRDLARPGADQLAMQADGSHKADEIALDFDDAIKYWKPRLWPSLSAKQRESIDAVDAFLTSMSGARNAGLWTEGAVASHEWWAKLRGLAKRAADALEPLSEA